MNILLVYPEFPYSFWSMDHLMQVYGKKYSYPPLGLLTVAAMLPREWNKKLIDLNIGDRIEDQDLAWADYVLVSAMNVQEPSCHEVFAQCHAAGARVVAGGPLFTHEFSRFTTVDHFVLNEAELTLPRFLEDLEKGCPKRVYGSPDHANVHETPIPLWELADLEKYAYAVVQYSRGCPYMCDFCDVTALFGRKPRTKTAKQMIAELEAFGDIDRFGMVVFADDNLMGNKKFLKSELLPALIEWRRRKKIVVTFATQITINLADDAELMDLMLKAGFQNIFIGIETPDDEGLEACKKTQNRRRDMIENVHLLHSAGFVITAGFIVGFDTDTPSIFQRQIDFIQESGIVIAGVSVLKAPPGTELYARMKREGRLIEEFNFHESETNIIPVMDPDVLRDGYKRVLETIYTPENIIRRTQNLLKVYRTSARTAPLKITEIKLRVLARYLAILGRIIYYLGIKGKHRRHFWNLAGWALKYHRDVLDLALGFGVWIYDLGKIYENHLALGHYESHVAKIAPSKSPQEPLLENG
ncbi:MAG: B12-binding domain-containing radical SAM protein [Gammaproteobacteria bacterium]